jgi:hypothetical protein
VVCQGGSVTSLGEVAGSPAAGGHRASKKSLTKPSKCRTISVRLGDFKSSRLAGLRSWAQPEDG